jgi:hypothetical protein
VLETRQWRKEERAAETLARRIENKELLSAAELRSALSVAQQTIDEAVASNRLFAFEGPGGQPYFPAFYADATVDGSAVELVAQELLDLPAPFVSRRTILGETPLEALKRGRVADVLRAESGFVIT